MKCLITKLEGSVTNDSLPKIGELRYFIKKTDDVRNVFLFDGIAGKAVKSVVSGKNYFTNANGEINNGNSLSTALTQDGNRYFKSLEDGYYTISQKYDIGRIIIRNYKDMEYDISDFSYCKNLTSLAISNTSVIGDIASLKALVNLTSLAISNTSVIGDIASLKALVNLTSLAISNTSVSGDIASLKSLVNLTSLNINNTSVSGDIASLKSLVNLTTLNVSNSSVSGDCKNLFDGLISAGRKSGKLKLWTLGKQDTNIVYNGQKPTKRVFTVTFSDGSYSVENTDN